MAVTVTQTPYRPFDMAYGANAITLNGITPSQQKYALRIFVLGNTVPIADIRQSPNRFGRAIFDIQNILQTQVQPTINNVDGLHYSASGFSQQNTRMQIANGELVQYQIAYTTETNGSLDAPFEQSSIVYTTLGGSKEYWQVPYDEGAEYIPIVDADVNGCTDVNFAARPLSDNTWTIADTETGDDLLTVNGGYPSPGGIDVQNVYAGDQCTKSFWQKISRVAGPYPANTAVQGIEAFHVLQCNSSGNITNTTTLANIQANGGGPNVSLGQGQIPTGNFNVITVSSGPANFPIGFLNPLTTHYYIVPVLYTPLSPTNCSTDDQSQTPIMSEAAWRIQRYNVLPTPCNDYDHIQFAWMNSEGFRDQFTFTKRNEKKINTTRNNFLKEAADFNDTRYEVDEQSRGFTTYSQAIKEAWTATSGYMNDQEAQLLESMFKSPSVNVRFSVGEYANQWIPINLISSSYTEKTYRKDRLFQYTVNYKLASNIKSQRG
mgnify:CR=1 FL=1|tara:strand:+ start:150 stop:1619 length:1470 start_codon:yes stop_codon:yes gene_type:complete